MKTLQAHLNQCFIEFTELVPTDGWSFHGVGPAKESKNLAIHDGAFDEYRYTLYGGVIEIKLARSPESDRIRI